MSEDVLVIMATHLSGKCSRCAAETSFHHIHTFFQRDAVEFQPFSFFLPTVSSPLLLDFLKISFLVHWLFNSPSFLPPVSLPPPPSPLALCQAPPAESHLMLSVCATDFFFFSDIRPRCIFRSSNNCKGMQNNLVNKIQQ